MVVTSLSILATVAGISMSMSALFQSYKIFKRKSARDISIVTFLVLTIGNIIWILYGIEMNNFPILITNSIGFFGAASIVYGWFLYGKEKK